jgi:hypothetical protein
MQKSDFRNWDLDKLDATFGLRQVRSLAALSEWLNMPYSINDIEKMILLDLQQSLLLGVDNWNEVELENKFISPLIMLVHFDNERFAYFLERELRGIVGDYDFAGRVDGMIASGFRNPHRPYFCLSEYKKQREPEGDPAAQALVAMLVAQELNEHRHPIYGSYIIGRAWHFMALVKHEYCISTDYSAAREQLFDLFRILQGLKQIITQRVQMNNA